MAMLRSNANRAFLPEQVGRLIVQPVQAESVAFQTTSPVTISGEQFRVPIVAEDPTAAWTAEGAEITPSDATLDEEVVKPAKVAGLTIISRELADDSSPAAAQIVGQGLARDIAKQVDAAFFGNLAAPAPPGLGSLTTAPEVDAGAAWADADPFAHAISLAEQEGATLTAFVANPTDALALSTLKEGTGSNKPLLGSDPTMPTRRTVQGVPLWVSPKVTAGTIWGYDRNFVMTVLREGTTLAVDSSAYFSSDRIGVRATMRVGFAFPHPASVIKISLTAP
ncbi:phage major capsid protein [Actinomadura sp. WAC 06369]|uniref:phage major capsid protein n=1 Tax=Actinomadura sp. WAC 06369 TaxID=2203193 RepID=UPI000F782D69|nr:phage major capsid protein [Actinomadura sp. WAC 06369]RSN50852.1 phage major capsid protein [Actinomadura sp. WAC 06369]